MAPDPIRVLVVDDHAVVREGLRTFLELQDGIEVVGEAADGEQAVERAVALAPDVILMDLVMPRLDGIGAMRQVRERVPESRVIVLTSFLDDERLMPALQAGASGYLLKDVEPADLARAVRSACADEAMIDPTVAARLLHTLSSERAPAVPAAALTDDEGDGDARTGGHLTRRERQVWELIALGRSNKRIALELGVAEKTVKTHVGHLLAKLGVADRTQAALLAVQRGATRASHNSPRADGPESRGAH
jgi:NarL family two-component system response regulator LiaR